MIHGSIDASFLKLWGFTCGKVCFEPLVGYERRGAATSKWHRPWLPMDGFDRGDHGEDSWIDPQPSNVVIRDFETPISTSLLTRDLYLNRSSSRRYAHGLTDGQ